MAHVHLYKILLGLFASVDLSLIFSAEDPGDHAGCCCCCCCCCCFFARIGKGCMRLYRSPMIRPPFTRVKFNLEDVTPTIQLEFNLVPRALVGGAGKA